MYSMNDERQMAAVKYNDESIISFHTQFVKIFLRCL